jgi:FKBP-type peptidyl-prolyl cis-trans isomerase SlyD
MSIVRDSVVRFHYRLSGEDGAEIENSHDSEPVTYLHGRGSILPALEAQLEGRGPGDSFSAQLCAADAYGERDETAVMRIPLKNLVYRGKLEPGTVAGVQTNHGMRQVRVLKVGKFNADVDANHPLAGQALGFHIEVVDVRPATEEEISHGHVHGEGGHHH